MFLQETKLLAAVDKNRDRIAKLTSDLVRFDTTAPNPGEDPHEDKQCQEYVRDELKALGFQVDLWEPEAEKLRTFPFHIPEQSFRNRPILAATLKGAGKGRSLILNAHVDVVPVDEEIKWKHDPWGGEIANGKVYGRGSCDMKAGAAAIIAACKAICESNLNLAGDIIVETVLDEEINGMGTVACIERGYRADAAMIPEPSDLNLWTACRGLLWGKITVHGRSGHAELSHPHWTEGGAVNPIEKAVIVLEGIRKLEDEWRLRSAKKHSLLSTPRIMPTIIKGGDFWATIPDKCETEMDIQYLPSDRDEKGYGSKVMREIEEHLAKHTNSDSWLRGHPATLTWKLDLPPMEISNNSPIVQNVMEAAKKIPIQLRITGFDSWDDGAHLMNLAGIPTISIGPGPTSQAHVVDEFVTVESTIKTTKLLCLSAVNWCGVS